jgi:hypothetical protein
VDYHIRYSLLATLGMKHKGSITKAIKTYGKDPRIDVLRPGKVTPQKVVQFITAVEIAQCTRKFLVNYDYQTLDLGKALAPHLGVHMLSNPTALLGTCAHKGCQERAVECPPPPA